MKIGIFSDIHGNLEALGTTLTFMQAAGVSEYLCLGDIVGYGANPEECINLVRELPGKVVAGNHDYGSVGRVPLESFGDAAREALEWTRNRISADSRRYLDSLPLVEKCYNFHLVHSAPSAPGDWEYILTLPDIKYEFAAFSESVCLIGHSHLPFAARKHSAKLDPQPIRDTAFLVTDHTAKFLINAGSVGQPRDGDPRCCLLIYDSQTAQMRFHRLDYDIEAAQQKILDAGLPPVLAARLSQGR